uniref:PIN domain-containing protein n=1 Tax=Anopheles atroparvus TaxID=41427 RepID=A0AAG5DWQ9_ANOAO
MEFLDQNANKENMARFLESEPSPRTEWSGIAERRMHALREQQRQELLLDQQASRASKCEESMDVDMDMDECCVLSPIQEKHYSSYNDTDNAVLPCANDADRRVKLHSSFAERLDQVEEEMDCSSEDDTLPSTDDGNRRVKQHSNFAEGLDQDTQYDFYVVDTCVYIDALEGVEELLMYCLDDENHSVVVVPYQVLQELDHLKEKKPELVDHVEAAVRFIRNNLDNEQRAMKAQHTSDYMDRLATGFSGDDSILDCALQLREQVPNVGTITMVSHDGVLRTKAVAAKLGETTINRLLCSLFN